MSAVEARPMDAVTVIVDVANEALDSGSEVRVATVYGDSDEQCRVAIAVGEQNDAGRTALQQAADDWKAGVCGSVYQLAPLGMEHMELTVTRPTW